MESDTKSIPIGSTDSKGAQPISVEPKTEPVSGDENLSYQEEDTHSDIPRDNATQIIQWLFENYSCSGSEKNTIPRSTVYSDYEAWCTTKNHNCYNAAMFGKIFKQAFPQVNTRRIGGRNSSRYHYVGIMKLKESDKNAAAVLLSQVKATYVTSNNVRSSIFEHHKSNTVAPIPVRPEGVNDDANDLRIRIAEMYSIMTQMKMRLDCLEYSMSRNNVRPDQMFFVPFDQRQYDCVPWIPPMLSRDLFIGDAEKHRRVV